MPYHSKYNSVGLYFPDDGAHRINIVNDATYEAQKVVDAEYPYAVCRSQHEATQVAETIYKEWLAYILKELSSGEYYDSALPKLNSQLNELKRIYVSAFVARYLEEVAEKDKKAGKQPSTSTTGATITVINQKHEGDIHTYWVRIADPHHFDEAQDFPLPLVVDFSEISSSEGTTATTSSSYGAYAASSSDAVPSTQQTEPKWINNISIHRSQSKTPQKKKPRFYFGK